MTISVVIPTINRAESLVRTLRSVLVNTLLPQEIIVIEQGDAECTKEKIAEELMASSSVALQVVFQKTKSASQARQTGADLASGELICFLDDDITIAPDYLACAHAFINAHPNVLGLTGAYQHVPRFGLKKLIAIFFGIYAWRGTNRVLPSGSYDFIRGKKLEKEQSIEFLYGCNMVLRKQVFTEGFSFPPSFIYGSFGEDVFFSYKIHQAYPGCLWYLPTLHVMHHSEEQTVSVSSERIRMKIVYRFLFWSQIASDGSWKSLLMYVWSQVGMSLFDFVQTPRWRTVCTLFDTYLFVAKHHKRLTEETIDFNAFIFSS